MIQVKQKRCKGSSKTKGFDSCGEMSIIKKYSLCSNCYRKWLLSTEEGKKELKKYTLRAKKEVKVKKKREIREKKRELNDGNAMHLADTYYSRFIRLYHSIDGNCTCYTCGVIKPIKEVDNGHYMKRQHKNTRYHENNCRPQCKICNGDTKHNGKQIEFRENLVNELGEGAAHEIELLSQETIKADYHFYKEKADYYRQQVNDLQKIMKVKYW
jgi:hypothetical protein